MRLLRLSLKNFKGLEQFVLDTKGGNVAIYGDNATGKTTLFDAFTWLLFDKDSSNQKDFAIKTLDRDGGELHGLEHSVEAVLDIGGKELALRKVYQEKWTKKRGSAQAEFTGHTTDHFVDGVPVKKNEYDAQISSIADEKVFRLLTDPAYFNEQLHWQERRRILLEVCGDISDDLVVGSDPSLAQLPDILKGRSLEDHRKVLAARRAELNRELTKIPTRIDEVRLGLPNIGDIADAEALPTDIAKLQAGRQAALEERARIQSGGEIAEKVKMLREIEAELLDLRNRHRAEIESEARNARAELAKIEDELAQGQSTLKGRQRLIADNHSQIQAAEGDMERLRDEWHRINSSGLVYSQEETCPACGQAIPPERLDAARAEALKLFNYNKAQQLEAINAKGNTAKHRAEALGAENAEAEYEIHKTECNLVLLELKATAAKSRIGACEQDAASLADDPAFVQKTAEKAGLEAAIGALRTGNEAGVLTVAGKIAEFDEDIAALEQARGRIEQHKRGLARIEELKAQERQLAAEFERLEHELYLTEQFVRSKVALLEERINSRFAHARFKLFEVQVNGAVAECCETLYQGVPYGTGLNRGARLNVGLDIINALSEHYGLTAPIFVDNREAVTQLIPTKGQLVSLVVSERDKTLRVVVGSSPAPAEGVA